MVEAGKLIVGLSYLVMLAVIASEKVDRLVASLATLVFVFTTSLVIGYADVLEAAKAIDWDVIGLVIVASIASWFIEDSGLAKRIAVFLVEKSAGSPIKFLLLASSISGFMSLYMENVTVVILLSPIVFSVSRILGVSPVPVLISVAVSSNLSGSALLVGDPQAAIVASAFNLDFIDFVFYRGLPSMFFVVVGAMIAAIISLPLYTRVSRSRSTRGKEPSSIGSIEFESPDKLYQTAVILGIIGKITLLALRKELGLSLTEAAAPPILLLVVIFGRRKLREIAKAALDYRLLGFLASLFYLVGFIDNVSLTKSIANAIEEVAGSLFGATILIIVLSTIASSVMDNVPFIAAMIPVIRFIAGSHGADPVVIAWALLLGATLGGNLTYIGAMANYTAIRLLEREGHTATFSDFAKIGIPFTIISLVVGSAIYYLTYSGFL